MKRKIIKQGTSTYMISLPKHWIKENNIEKGQEINIEKLENDLLISSKEIKFPIKKADLYINKFNLPLIYRAYRLGYSQVKLNFNSLDVEKQIRNIIGNLIGADIIEIERNHFNIIFSNPEIKIDRDYNLLKVLRLLKWEFSFLKKDLYKKEEKSEEELNLIYLEIVRRIEFILRQTYLKNRIGEEFLIFMNLLEPIKQIQEEIMLYYSKSKKVSTNENISDLYISFLEKTINDIYLSLKNNDFSPEELDKLNELLNLNLNKLYSKKNNLNSIFPLELILGNLFKTFLNYLVDYLSYKNEEKSKN